jgi:hypothetical protein
MRISSCTWLSTSLFAFASHFRRIFGALKGTTRLFRWKNWTRLATTSSTSVTKEKTELLLAIRERHLLRTRGEAVLGTRIWPLFFGYGRVMSGPYSGQYVSGIPTETVHALLDALFRGDSIDIHLMHNHISGNYESSGLVLVNSRLVMKFP